MKKLKTWTIKRAWKTPGPVSVTRLYQDQADAEYFGHETAIPVSIVVTELPVPAKKTKGRTAR
jgi:hypothetical protein